MQIVDVTTGELKLTLFKYLSEKPGATPHDARKDGMSFYVDVLYGGKFERAVDDCHFYRFVVAAREYDTAESPQQRNRARSEIRRHFDYRWLPEGKIAAAIFGSDGAKKLPEKVLRRVIKLVEVDLPIYPEDVLEGYVGSVERGLPLGVRFEESQLSTLALTNDE